MPRGQGDCEKVMLQEYRSREVGITPGFVPLQLDSALSYLRVTWEMLAGGTWDQEAAGHLGLFVDDLADEFGIRGDRPCSEQLRCLGQLLVRLSHTGVGPTSAERRLVAHVLEMVRAT